MKRFLLCFFILITSLCKAQPPQMSYPTFGIDTLPVKFSYWWKHVSGGVAYRIECDTTAQFNSPLKRTLLHNDPVLQSYNPGSNVYFLDSNYYYNTAYYWKVKTIFASDSSSWSGVESFKTREMIDIISPTDFANITPASFFVAHIAGSTQYELQLDTDPIFTNPIYIYKTVVNYSNHTDKQPVMIPGTGYSPNTSYSWRIRAFNAVDSTEWSKAYTFTTKAYSNNVTELSEGAFIYPNPASDKLNINNANKCTIVVCDIDGKEIDRFIAEPKYILDVSNYFNGLYILQIFEGNSAIGVKKFSVIK